jgi:hypothetical protein
MHKTRIFSRALPVLIAVATLAVAVRSFGLNDDGDAASAYAIGLWADPPHSTVQATTGVPNLIADMNSQNLAFTAHDGDLKSGSSECADSVYTQALGYFNSLQAPAAFTTATGSPVTMRWFSWIRNAGSFSALLTHSGNIVCARKCSRHLCVSAPTALRPAWRTAVGRLAA